MPVDQKSRPLRESRSAAVINRLENLQVNTLSFAELRQLNAALSQLGDIVTAEIARRSSSDVSGDTVKVAVPPVVK